MARKLKLALAVIIAATFGVIAAAQDASKPID